MANWYLGINRGKLQNVGANVTVGTSTGSTDVELRIDTTKSSTKEDVILAMRAIENYILSNGIPSGVGAGVDLPPN